MKKYYYVYLERFTSQLCSDGETLEKFESKEEALKSAEDWISGLAIQDKRCEKIQVWYADEITEENEDGTKEIVLGGSNGKAIRFNENDVRPIGRSAAGVRGMELPEGEKLVGMAVLTDEKNQVLVVTEKGYGKRTNVDAFRVQIRGGKGVKALNTTEKTGKMVSLRSVEGNEDLIIITDGGITVRLTLEQVSSLGRNTQGVRLIMLNDGHSVANIAIVPRSDDSDEEFDEDFIGKMEFDEAGDCAIFVGFYEEDEFLTFFDDTYTYEIIDKNIFVVKYICLSKF